MKRSATRRPEPARAPLPAPVLAVEPEDDPDDDLESDDLEPERQSAGLLLRELRKVDTQLARGQVRRAELARRLHEEAGYSWRALESLTGISRESLRRWATGS